MIYPMKIFTQEQFDDKSPDKQLPIWNEIIQNIEKGIIKKYPKVKSFAVEYTNEIITFDIHYPEYLPTLELGLTFYCKLEQYEICSKIKNLIEILTQLN